MINEEKQKHLEEGVARLVADLIKSLPESPTMLGIGLGVVWLPSGSKGDSTVTSVFVVDENYVHQTLDVLQDLSEAFGNHRSVIIADLVKGN